MGKLASKAATIGQIVAVDVSLISPNPAQPRKSFDSAELQSLADSIRENGLLQPLTVRKRERSYELISGERRLRAIKLAGLAKAPCIVVETTQRQSAVLALLENIQREDLNYFEEAAALQNLMVEWGVSQQELGMRLGKAQSTIANKLRLLKYEPKTRQRMLELGLNERQARALLRLEHPEQLAAAMEAVSRRGCNATQTDRYVDGLLAGAQKPTRVSRPIVKDVRLFFNTINHAIRVMKQSGIPASTEKIEREDCIEYIVKIPVAPAG